MGAQPGWEPRPAGRGLKSVADRDKWGGGVLGA
jgi:hypothetical protein